jgi:hypothetical protein
MFEFGTYFSTINKYFKSFYTKPIFGSLEDTEGNLITLKSPFNSSNYDIKYEIVSLQFVIFNQTQLM